MRLDRAGILNQGNAGHLFVPVEVNPATVVLYLPPACVELILGAVVA